MRNKNVIGVIAICLVLVLAVGVLGYFSKGFKDWEYKDWFKKDTEETDDLLTVTESRGIKLAFSSMSTGDSNTRRITATVTPANATNKNVNWTIGWLAPESDWAVGKTATDYATITPTADGALTADLTCIKAFGEVLVVTVTSRSNTDKYAICTFEYAKRLTGFGVTLNADGGTANKINFTVSGITHSFSTNTTAGIGTIDDNFAEKIELKLEDEFYTYMCNAFESRYGYCSLANNLYEVSSLSVGNFYEVFGDIVEFWIDNEMAREFLQGVLTDYTGAIIRVYFTYTGEYSVFEQTKTYKAGIVDLWTGVNSVGVSVEGDDIF